MLSSAQSLDWSCALFRQLEGWLGYPKTDSAMGLACKEFLAIVHDQTRGEWLFDQLVRGCKRFPTPSVMREIYNNRWDPADGIKPEDLFVAKFDIRE